jgi:hypothetical protein
MKTCDTRAVAHFGHCVVSRAVDILPNSFEGRLT